MIKLTRYIWLGKKLIYPLIAHINGLLLDHLASILLDPLVADIQDQLLHVFRRQGDQHSKEEAPFDLLWVLEAPFVRDVLVEPWQLRGLRPNSGNAELWPQRHLEASVLKLTEEALTCFQKSL